MSPLLDPRGRVLVEAHNVMPIKILKHQECRVDEEFVGNCNLTNRKKRSMIKEKFNARFGKQAYDIHGEKIDREDYLPIFIPMTHIEAFEDYKKSIEVERLQNHILALGYKFSTNVHNKEEMFSLFVEQMGERDDFPNRDEIVEFICENTQWNICDKCMMIEISEDLVWLGSDGSSKEQEDIGEKLGNYANYVAICDDCFNYCEKLFNADVKTLIVDVKTRSRLQHVSNAYPISKEEAELLFLHNIEVYRDYQNGATGLVELLNEIDEDGDMNYCIEQETIFGLNNTQN